MALVRQLGCGVPAVVCRGPGVLSEGAKNVDTRPSRLRRFSISQNLNQVRTVRKLRHRREAGEAGQTASGPVGGEFDLDWTTVDAETYGISEPIINGYSLNGNGRNPGRVHGPTETSANGSVNRKAVVVGERQSSHVSPTQVGAPRVAFANGLRASVHAGAGAAVGPLQQQQQPAATASASLSAILSWIRAFVAFTRPHTIVGTALSVVSVSVLGLPPNLPTALLPLAFKSTLQALVPALCMNVYIVGLNQLFDIEIDKVNKPYLPLASGEFSVPTGVALISLAATAAVALGLLAQSPPLLGTLLFSMLLGTAYSIDVPFLRWKRSPLLAACCILAVRAVVVQLGFFAHIQLAVLHQQPVVTTPLLFATAFMCLFSVVIALFKDIPDVEGDRVFGILSLSVRLGQKRVYWLCISILMAAYAAAVAVAALTLTSRTRLIAMGAHIVAATVLWLRAQRVDLGKPASISSVYMDVWKLFYAEYLILPLMRV